jgi:hypothetical protein
LSQYYLQAMDKDPITGKPMPKVLSRAAGSFYRLAAEPKPTSADGVQDGDDLLLVDTKETFIFYKGVWYAQ